MWRTNGARHKGPPLFEVFSNLQDMQVALVDMGYIIILSGL